MKFCFMILAIGRNIGEESESYNVTMRFNKLDDSFNFGFGHFNRDREIEQKISDKYDQPTLSRVTHLGFEFFKNNFKGIVWILEHIYVMFKTSDAMLCCVDVAFDVRGVAGEFSFCRVRK